DSESIVNWEAEARSPLFRSKRAVALSRLLRARAVLNRAFAGGPSANGLRQLLFTGDGRRTFRTLLRRAKGETMGVSLADITVCGAVAPYNHLLGGKLVAMLLTSPELVQAYHRKYADRPVIITSAMAGRPITRPLHLAALCTTSLYGVALSQYTN